ncbi:uncharacterized protein [Dermacentor andersoni]|uniref:uncharacterized protein n=1 Tax=Dermacentor andersoni TaxID=34620 RepID=UPI002418125D|nr:uncharacterized protein LOC129383965 [Dermacentor andersoni]
MYIQAAVIYGHVIFDDRGHGVVVPPTFWNSSATAAHYPFNLDTAHTALQNMATEKLGYTQLFLSVTMAGRHYKPHKNPGMLEKNDAIKDPLFVSIALACKSYDYIWGYHNTTPMGAYYHSWKRRRTLTYDDEDSFREKASALSRTASLQTDRFLALQFSSYCVMSAYCVCGNVCANTKVGM